MVLTTHPSLSGRAKGTGESGSTAWNNAVRSRLYLTAAKDDEDDEDRDWRTLQRKKGNYAAAGGEVRLHWRNGVFVPPVAEDGLVGTIDRGNCAAMFLHILAKREAQERAVSDRSRAGNYAPREFAKDPDRQGFDARAFERAMTKLFDEHRIVIRTYGRAGDRRQRIASATTEGDR